MKITFTYEREGIYIEGPTKIQVESDSCGVSDILEDFKAFLLALSFSPETVERIEIGDKDE